MSKPEIKSFRPRALNGDVVHEYAEVKAKFGSLALTDHEANPTFALYPTSKKLLGIEREERGHLEERVKAEVERQVSEIRDTGYQEGFLQGQKDGQTKAEVEFKTKMQPLFEQFVAFLAGLDGVKEELYTANERVLIQIMFQMGRQILLRELKTDPEYVKRLSAQMIDTIGAKDSVRLKIGKDDLAQIEQIRDFIKGQFPELKNIQIEGSDDLASGGCKVETDLSRINASVETQFAAFESALQENS